MKNKKTFWSLILLIFVLFTAGWFSVYASFYLNTRNDWALPIVFFYFALALYGVFIISEKSKYVIGIVAGAVLLPSLALARGKWYLMAVFLLFCYALFLASGERIKYEAKNRLKIKPSLLFRYGIAFLSTGIGLLVSAGFYFSIQDKSDATRPELGIEIPNEIIFKIMELSGAVYPNEDLRRMNEGFTVDEYITESSKNLLVGFENSGTAVGQKDEIYYSGGLSEGMVEASRQKLSRQLGIEISGDKEMKQVVADYVNARIKQFFLSGSSKEGFLPVGIALGLFLTLKTIAWILTYFLIWTTEVIFRIMLWMRMLVIVKVQKEAEEIE